jgi:hypothetical protein
VRIRSAPPFDGLILAPSLNPSTINEVCMVPEKEDGTLYQYLLAEMQGARTNIIGLWSSTIALVLLAIVTLPTQFGAVGIIAVFFASIQTILIIRYIRYVAAAKGVAKGHAAGSLGKPLHEAFINDVLPKEVGFATYQPEPVPRAPSAVSWVQRWGALTVVIAALFVWGAGAYGASLTTNIAPWFWVYWAIVQFLAVWTFTRAVWLVGGRTEHRIRMFTGWVFWSMVLASMLFLIVGPSVAASTSYTTVALAVMSIGVGLWAFAAGAWAWSEYGLKAASSADGSSGPLPP